MATNAGEGANGFELRHTPCSADQISVVLRQVVRSRRRIRSGGRPMSAGQAGRVTKT
ncbi:protein of unassigned function [Methylobacterium oryzae CBMB20]|uniref:Protein of unassigned function n=1 Tax=Methylobacterium oryzae CBMB20 TaxID=693986 RepID=A0A089NWP7_9HYPH|nr:protein of unassigned function [Methylobacterium oryzae CBMB20]